MACGVFYFLPLGVEVRMGSVPGVAGISVLGLSRAVFRSRVFVLGGSTIHRSSI
jgi:hypothetical protein